MANLTLKQLRYFEALAAQRHFGRAADVCAISQPALSVQIRELEETLGVGLFERGARQVRLTGFGEDFALRVRDILRAVDELGDLARAAQGGIAGRLRIGVIPTIAPYLLPGFIRALSRSHPQIDVHIRETITPRLVAELIEGRIDAAIGEPSLTEMALFDEDMLLVRPMADAGLPVPSPDTLCDMRLLLLEQGHCFRDHAQAFCGGPARRMEQGLDGSSLSTLVQMVGAGIGVTLIPEMALAVEARSAPVSVVRLAGAQPGRSVGMIWRRTNPLAKHLGEVAEVVREAGSGRQAATPPHSGSRR